MDVQHVVSVVEVSDKNGGKAVIETEGGKTLLLQTEEFLELSRRLMLPRFSIVGKMKSDTYRVEYLEFGKNATATGSLFPNAGWQAERLANEKSGDRKAHSQLFPSILKDKPALYFPVKVAQRLRDRVNEYFSRYEFAGHCLLDNRRQRSLCGTDSKG